MIFLILRWLLELIVFLVYYIFIKIIPFCIVFGLPLFLVGIIIGILGVSGHIIFLLLVAFAIYKYYDIVIKSTFNISSKNTNKKKKVHKDSFKSLVKEDIGKFAKSLNPLSKK